MTSFPIRMTVLLAPGVIFLAHFSSAYASGAVAVGQTGNISRGGLAIGWATSSATKTRAEALAMEKCLGFKEAPETRALCKIVSSFEEQYLAIALDPKAGTPGYGWAVRPAQSEAKSVAMKNCRSTAKGRADFCIGSDTICDGKAK